jgi:hypothetical protein
MYYVTIFVKGTLNEFYLQLTPWPVVRKRTIPTEGLPLIGKVGANFSG